MIRRRTEIVVQQSRFHESSVVNGFFFGFLIAGLGTLLAGPRIPLRQMFNKLTARGQEVVQQVEKRVTSDPVTESIEEGKAAARRRLQTLNARLN